MQEQIQSALKSYRKGRLITIGLLILGFLVLVGAQLLADHTSSRSVDFQTFAPQVLPTGYKITSAELDIERRSFFPPDYTKQVVINLYNHGSISEEKNMSFTYTCNTHTRNDTCSVHYTKNHQEYLLDIVTDPNTSKLFSEEISWINNGTHIWMTLNDLQSNTTQDWGGIIDSFSFHPYKALPVLMRPTTT